MSDADTFKLHGWSRDGKCVYIRGPVDLEVDADDCDDLFVQDMLPAIVQALNSDRMRQALVEARKAQEARWADEKAEAEAREANT